MNHELLEAVKERQQLGHSKEEIYAALEAAGYDHDAIEHVYEQAALERERTAIPLAGDSAGEQFVPGADTSALAGPWALFTGGWSYMVGRLDFVLFLGVMLSVLTIASYFLDSNMALSVSVSIVAVVMLLGAIVAYILGAFGLLHAVAVSTESRESIGNSIRWAKANIWSISWISILVLIVILGGFVLFIIPGLIMSLYLYFAQYVYVTEGVKGFAALKRSVGLVTGHWWALFWRFTVLGLLCLAPVFIIAFVAGLGVAASGIEGTSLDLAIEVVMQFVGAAITILLVHAVFTILRQLAARKPHTDTSAGWILKLLAVLGAVSVIGFILLGALGAAMMEDAMNDTLPPLEFQEFETSLEQKESLRNVDRAVD